MKTKTLKRNILIAAAVMSCSGFAGTAFADQESDMAEMIRANKKQQEQLDEQSKTLDAMKAQLAALEASKGVGGKGFVKSGNSNASVKLYGHINRGVMAVDDGDNSKLYQVDNDAAQSRFGIRGSIQATDNIEIGTVVEAGLSMNGSASVSQDEPRGASNKISMRHVDMYLSHANYGKLFMGHGSTASDGTSEVDLSGTDLVGYSYSGDFGAGIAFFDKDSSGLSGLTVGDTIDNMDGLGRDVRLRYDSPSFAGLKASGSYIADGGGDVALKYSGAFSDVKLEGAVAYANPGSTSDTIDNQYNGSLSALHSTGFNVTFAGGKQDYKEANVDNGYFYYGKLGYRNKFFSTGETAFSVDYGRYEDISNDVVAGDADVFGAQLVHNFATLGVDVYAGYRNYSVDTDTLNTDNINVVMTGARISF